MKSALYKTLIFCAVLTTFLAFSFFNANEQEPIFTFIEGNEDWKKIKEDIQISEGELLNRYQEQMGFGPKDVLHKHRTSQDKAGNTHTHYQHYHNGYRVFGSQFIIHSNTQNKVYLVNGRIAEHLELNTKASLSKEEAIEIAKEEFPGAKFMWENDYMESFIKKIDRNPTATFFPEAPLVYYRIGEERISENYRLVYEVDIHTYAPELKETVYVDALDGTIVLRINDLHTGGDHEGVAETRYHGTRTIITDSIGVDSFVLVDSTRGPGVFTYNARRQEVDSSTVDFFYDDDNYWNNINAFQDEVATDAHWGTEMTYDFYTNVLGREGLSGDSIPLISFVHVRQNWTNATWNGRFARFGDSDDPNSPLTAIDVVGHEFAHGLTDYTADLVYMNEPGALNESFSDIFGTVQEFLYDPATADWEIGEDFIASGGFRSMQNPKDFNNPHTYFGQFWTTGAGDNGGVHTNSGVQNFWFYLISEGGEGINDIGNTYSVDSLGLDKATQIAYGNLNNYLTVESQYIDARLGSIQASVDLYGDCSYEKEATTDAWFAVGVGQRFERNDIELLQIVGPDNSICGTSSEVSLTVEMRYADCQKNLVEGDYIPFEFTVNFGDVYFDTLFVSDTIFSQDTFVFEFNTTIPEFALPGDYEINLRSSLEGDNIEQNSILRDFYHIRYDQNVDLAYAETLSPVSGCYLSVEEEVSVRLQFLGCDSIVGGEAVELVYKLNEGDWVSENFTLDSTFYADEFIDFTFQETSIDLEENGNYQFQARLIYEADTLLLNNESSIEFFKNPIPLQRAVEFTFEGTEESYLDSFYVIKGQQARVEILDSVGFNQTSGLAITGSNGLDLLLDDRLVEPSLGTVWTKVNTGFKTESCMCADLRNTTSANLQFRVNQSFSPIYNDLFGLEMKYASALRVTVNGKSASPTYIPVDNESDFYLFKNISLADYHGETIEICFQTHTLLDQENDPYGIGDNIYLDNIVIKGVATTSTEDVNVGEGKIYPNPARETITIENDWTTSYELTIMNINGQVVKRMAAYTDRQILRVDELPEGMYVVKSEGEEGIRLNKLIVQ